MTVKVFITFDIFPPRSGEPFIRAVGHGETVGWLVAGMAKSNKTGTSRIVAKPGGSLLYALRTVTRHRADKMILPEKAKLSAAAAAAITGFIGSFEG